MLARLVVLSLLLGLSGCYSLSCPAEFATPFERARFCGQGQAAGPAAHGINAAALPAGVQVMPVTTVTRIETMQVR